MLNFHSFGKGLLLHALQPIHLLEYVMVEISVNMLQKPKNVHAFYSNYLS